LYNIAVTAHGHHEPVEGHYCAAGPSETAVIGWMCRPYYSTACRENDSICSQSRWFRNYVLVVELPQPVGFRRFLATAGLWEHGNEPWSSVKCGDLHDWMSKCWRCRKSVSWSL